MIAPILLKGVEPVVAAKLVGGGRDHALPLLPELDVGDVLSAQVEAVLPDGSYKVMIGSQPMSMKLPSYVVPGDTLELSYVTREPRLTFALNGVVPATTEAAPQLSAAGRLVAATMLQAGELASPIAAAATAPLLGAPPADGAELAGTLAQTLAASGLFYESHQAQWLAGERDLAQIRQEPQAQLTAGEGAPARDAGAASATAAAIELSAASPQGSAQTIDPRTLTLVQQQLSALDGARFAMQIEIWPRQWMRWEIDEEQPDTGREPDRPLSWNTQLHLDLPQLGELRAAITLAAESLRIRLETDSAASAALLQRHSAALHTALDAAGVPAAAIAIARHEQA